MMFTSYWAGSFQCSVGAIGFDGVVEARDACRGSWGLVNKPGKKPNANDQLALAA